MPVRHIDLFDTTTLHVITGAGAPELDPATGAPARSRSGDVPFRPIGRRDDPWNPNYVTRPGFQTEPRRTLAEEDAIREAHSIRGHGHRIRSWHEIEHDRDPANAHRMRKHARIRMRSPTGNQVVEVTELQAAPWRAKGWRRA
jgi:hypothetical protein